MKQTNLPSERQLAFAVSGDLTSANADVILKELSGMIEAKSSDQIAWKIFLLDLSRAKMVDSAGLNVIVAILKRVQKLGATMQILYANQNVYRILVFTRLDQHITLINAQGS